MAVHLGVIIERTPLLFLRKTAAGDGGTYPTCSHPHLLQFTYDRRPETATAAEVRAHQAPTTAPYDAHATNPATATNMGSKELGLVTFFFPADSRL